MLCGFGDLLASMLLDEFSFARWGCRGGLLFLLAFLLGKKIQEQVSGNMFQGVEHFSLARGTAREGRGINAYLPPYW